ncbi:MAG: exonuclease subunit SbcD [Clostridia bacterium]|nr:exonuclease subunit SbcD [Clostridia bacterium]
MRILHTSDWHIGKRLSDRERLPEQEEALDEIVKICEQESVELVLVAGDVFDTFTPPAEAEELFYTKIKKIAGENRAVVIVSGNHDDGVRLSAAAPFAGDAGVYLFGNKPKKISLNGNRKIHAVKAGDFYLLLENEKGEKVYINALPYPNEASLKEEKSDESYSERISRRILRGEEGYEEGVPYILLTHLFAAGGKCSESERDIDLGGARAVPPGLFPKNAYVAMGHLHRPQKMAENVFYSGSLLQYSFDEANTEKSVRLLETEGDKVKTVKVIPLQSGKKLVRPECNDVEEALKILSAYQDNFVELTLNLAAPLTSQETQSLKDASDGLIFIIPRVKTGEAVPVFARARLSAGELFNEYYRSKFGDEPKSELTEKFLSLLKEEE